MLGSRDTHGVMTELTGAVAFIDICKAHLTKGAVCGGATAGIVALNLQHQCEIEERWGMLTVIAVASAGSKRDCCRGFDRTPPTQVTPDNAVLAGAGGEATASARTCSPAHLLSASPLTYENPKKQSSSCIAAAVLHRVL